MAQDPNPPSTGDPDVDYVLKKFNAARKYARLGFWDTWKQCRSLYNNQRVMANYMGNSDGFVPETFTIIQALKSHVVKGGYKTQFLPRDDGHNGDVEVLNNLMDFAFDQDMTDTKVDAAIDDQFQVGNGYLFQYVDDGGLACNKYVSTEDAFFDPDATNYRNLGYAGYRYLTNQKDLEDEEVVNIDYDPENPKSEKHIKRFKNTDQLKGSKAKTTDDKTAKQLRDEMTSGSVYENKDDVVEVIVFYDYENQYYIGNRKVLLEKVETPFKRDAKEMQSVDDQGQPVKFMLPKIKPFLPVAPFRNYVDGALWYAKGDVEVVMELQERLNDTQNQKTDNLSYVLNRMWALDPAYAHKIDEIQNVPGAVFTVPPGALQEIQTPPLGQDADIEIARIKDEMRRATAADEIMFNASKGEMSKFQVQAQIAEGTTRFANKLDKLQNEGFRIMAENMFKIMQIYITSEKAVRLVGKEGVTWQTYNPGNYLGDYDVKVMLGSNSQTVKETEKQNAMQFFLLGSKLPFVDQQKLFIMTGADIFDKEENVLKDLIVPPPETPAPTIHPKLIETVKFEQLYPEEQAELLADSGVTPSQQREQASGVQNPPVSAPYVQNEGEPGGAGATNMPGSVDMNRAQLKPAGARISNMAGIPQA